MPKFFGKLSVLSFFVFCFAILFSVNVFGQDLDNVTISGKITDSNNAPITGATVTATLVSTNAERTVTTNEDGNYRFIKLTPGVYKIKVSATGFGAKERVDLQTISGQSLQLDFSLAPAGVQAEQTVTVTEEDAPAVDTTRTIVGGTIAGRDIEELPLNTRNPLDLVLTLGGTAEEALSTRDLAEDRNVTNATAPAEQGNFSLSGGVSYSNNITIDGLDNNDDRSANFRFQPSLEMVEEVQVVTNQFSGEYGRASGGRINLRLRSGKNTLQGRAFMFFRDDNLNANSWYNNFRKYTPVAPLVYPPDTNPLYNRLPFTEYNPGFTLSGPVVFPKIYNGKNRTFFSVGYEYTNLQDTTFINTWVPTASNPNFPLPAGTGNCPFTSCLDTNSSPAVALLPYTKSFPTPNVGHIFTAKLDHNFNDKNNFTVTYLLGRRKNQRTTAASVTRLDDALQARTTDSDAISFTDNHVFDSRTVNQFRFQYSIYEPSYQTDRPLDPVVLVGYRNPETGASQTLIVGNSTASGGNSETFPQNRRETRFQYQDTLSYILGNHTLKGGFDIQTIRSKAKELADATGTFNFANMGTFQSNTLSRFRLNFGTGSDVKNTYWSLFFNDEARLTSNFTLNYGVRYERETTVDDKNNFGPRLGIAWDPFGKGNGVIRFGAGVFYNRTLLRTVADSIQNVNGILPFDTNAIGTGATDVRRIAVLAAIAQRFPNSYATEQDLKNLVVAACATITTTLPCNSNTGFIINSGSGGNPLRSVEPDLKIPESYQFNVGFEKEIAKGWVFEVNYTRNKTVRLWRDRNINVPVLPSGYNDWTAFLVANPYTFTNANGTVRTYRFYTGNVSSVGTSTTQGGTTACPTTTTTDCWVNLNTTSTTTTSPSTAVTGSTTNSVGGAIGIALAAIARFRPDPNFEEKSRIGSNGKAFYQGVIFELRSRYKKYGAGFGGTLRFNYTLSSTKDDGLNNTSNAQINGDFASEYTRNVQDRRHRIALSGTFDTPFWLGRLKFSPLLRAGSSAPFSIGIGGSDRNLDDLGTDRPNFSGNISSILWQRSGAPTPLDLYNQFSLPTIGSRGGNLARNAGTGPSFYTFDLNVSREFKLGEKMKLRPTVQVDNVFNAAVFNFGAAFIDYGSPTGFLVPTRTFRARQIRLGMRFDF
ncbi:MAG TPA: TonB-dependent receptor [Pyrinomonadaceae bacterium]|nr:TonB-dependent receptor [Pyrinomonadaceae bacterium]